MSENKLPPSQSSSVPAENDQVETAENVDIPLEERVRAAEELKARGNDHFRAKEWSDAMSAYQLALDQLPKREVSKRTNNVQEPFGDDGDDDRPRQADQPIDSPSTSTSSVPGKKPSENDITCVKLRAVLNANIAACHVKLGSNKEAVDACTQAILDDPQYVKALQRRAAANEQINTWSSLSSAQEDYNTLLKLLPDASPQYRDVQKSLRVIAPRVEAAQKAETAEMLGKLKNLGNSILGNFGLSTDNFKFEPNGQGGYSMQFTR